MRGSSSLNGHPVGFESALEHDFLTRLSLHPNIIDVLEQPFILRYVDQEGRSRRYTPDFLVTYAHPVRGARQVLYEIKYRDDLVANWSEVSGRIRAGVRWALSHRAAFCVMTEREIRTPSLQNARRLRPYRHLEAMPAIESRLLKIAEQGGTISTVASRVAEEIGGGITQESVEAQVLRLVALGDLIAPLQTPLLPDTPIFPKEPSRPCPPLSRASP